MTDRTAFSVGHLFASAVYNGGPAPNIFSSWIYNYIIDGMNRLKEEVPQELSGSIFVDLYKQVGVENYVVVVRFSFGAENVKLNVKDFKRQISRLSENLKFF